MNGLLGEAFGPLEQQLHFRVARQGVLAANLANADTPHYRRRDLHFDAALASASVPLRASHASHVAQPAGGPFRVEVGPPGTRPDGNGVSLDTELVQANRNAGAFMDYADLLARIVSLQRLAITGR